MNTHHDLPDSKRWVLLDHLPIRHSKKILLLVFLYSLAFTLLLVGLKLFCQNLSNSDMEQPEEAAQAAAMVTPKSKDGALSIQQNIAEHIIRLHVIANSDSEEDQALKLEVRDEILSKLQDSLIHADTPAIAGKILDSEKEMISETAAAKIRQKGYNYPVRVVLEQRYFPAKAYGELTFPPGNYQALCIEIGAAKGKNWWCVLFPSLCFVNDNTAVVPEESKEKLRDSLSPEAYDSLGDADSSAAPAPNETDHYSPAPVKTYSPRATAKPEFRSAIIDWIRQR